jgi:hypothetical protein
MLPSQLGRGSFGQLVDLGKPNLGSGQDGYAQVESVPMIGRISSLKQHEWTGEIGLGGNDRLWRDAYYIFHHYDGIHRLRTHQTFPQLWNRIALVYSKTGQPQNRPAMASVIAETQEFARHRDLSGGPALPWIDDSTSIFASFGDKFMHRSLPRQAGNRT